MDFNVELRIREETQIEDQEAYCRVQEFLRENSDLDGIHRIQIDEILAFLKSGLDACRAPGGHGAAEKTPDE